MSNENMSLEEYKLRVMRSRFAERVSEYEDQISTLLTNQAQLQQRLAQLEGQGEDKETNEVVSAEEVVEAN